MGCGRNPGAFSASECGWHVMRRACLPAGRPLYSRPSLGMTVSGLKGGVSRFTAAVHLAACLAADDRGAGRCEGCHPAAVLHLDVACQETFP